MARLSEGDELLQRGLQLHADGDVQGAEACFRQLIELMPQHAELHHVAGLLALDRGDAVEAVRLLRQATVLDPREPLYFFSLGSVLLDIGEYDQALAVVGQCLQIDPWYPGGCFMMGRVHAMLGQSGAARERFEEAILREPENPLLYLGLAELHLRRNFYDQAIATLDTALQLVPEDAQAMCLLAIAHEGNGALDRAKAALEQVVQRYPDHAEAVQNLLRLNEKIRQLADEASFRQQLEELIVSIVPGQRITSEQLFPVLCRTDLKQRCDFNQQLAKACLDTGDADHLRQAKVFIDRAWVLSGFSAHVLPLYIEIYAALEDIPGIREAYKRLGMESARRGEIGQALACFNDWQNAWGRFMHLDKFEYDFDVLEQVERMAEPFRFTHQPEQHGYRSAEKIRLAYLVRGMAEVNSVLLLISMHYARHHDKSRFDIAFFCVETQDAVERSPQGRQHMESIRAAGCGLVFPLEADAVEDRLIALAKSIHDWKADLLVTTAVLATLEHYFVMAMRPAPKTLGYILGPMPQFAPPALDWGITASRHTQMDSPCNCSLIGLEFDLPQPETVPPLDRRELGVPEGAFLVGSAGRPQKFQDAGFWRAIQEMLTSHQNVHFIAVGVLPSQVLCLESIITPDNLRRIHFFGWRADYLGILASTDVLIDTYPSGGGVVLLDAMALGVPLVSFENDYTQPYDQTTWSLAEEFVPVHDLIVPRGDFSRLQNIVSRLIRDPAYRSDVANRCRAFILERHGDPRRMVRRCENVYLQVIGSPNKEMTG